MTQKSLETSFSNILSIHKYYFIAKYYKNEYFYPTETHVL